MNPKCLGRAIPDTFDARSADFTGLKMRRITRADSGRRSGAPSRSIVVIVVIVVVGGAKATRLRVDRHFARLPIMDPVTSIYLPLREMTTFDHPSVCNFCKNLLCGHWAISRNEGGWLGLLRVRDHQVNAPGE